MSRTKRIYNSKHWKWHSEHQMEFFNTHVTREVTGENTEWFGFTVITVKYIYDPEAWEWRYKFTTFPYHPYKELCMGCCETCRTERAKRSKKRRLENRLQEKQLKKRFNKYPL